jgi:hypothetical protein
VRELIAIARRNERAEDLPGILWALKELAHHGGGYFEDLRELRQRCAGATLGSLIDVQVAVLPFLESDLVQQMSGVLSEEALELMTQTDDQEMRKRLWLACHHARDLRGNRTRPTIGIDTETHVLIRELETPGLGYRTEAAARLLSTRGMYDEAAVPSLMKVLRDHRMRDGVVFPREPGVPLVHRWVAVAISKRVPGTEAAMDAHGYLFLYGNRAEKMTALRELRVHRGCAKPAVAYLVQSLAYKNPAGHELLETAKRDVISTLGIIGKGAVDAVPVLRIYGGREDSLGATARVSLDAILTGDQAGGKARNHEMR